MPVNLSALSASAGPLERYAPVRHAALAAPAGGTYARLRRLIVALGHGAALPRGEEEMEVEEARPVGTEPPPSLCVVSTNIDGLAEREGLPELQLHGTPACHT